VLALGVAHLEKAAPRSRRTTPHVLSFAPPAGFTNGIFKLFAIFEEFFRHPDSESRGNPSLRLVSITIDFG